jgi:small subunit ribosomal protein S8
MSMTDPIADMLSRIRNASSAMHDEVLIPASKIKQNIARILADEGFVDGFDTVEDGTHLMIRIHLR